MSRSLKKGVRRPVKLSRRDQLDVATIKLDDFHLPEHWSHCSIIWKNETFKTVLNHSNYMSQGILNNVARYPQLKTIHNLLIKQFST